ncbi:MAG TPA: chromosome partitioning protein [Micromonosporaceae bacterium]
MAENVPHGAAGPGAPGPEREIEPFWPEDVPLDRPRPPDAAAPPPWAAQPPSAQQWAPPQAAPQQVAYPPDRHQADPHQASPQQPRPQRAGVDYRPSEVSPAAQPESAATPPVVSAAPPEYPSRQPYLPSPVPPAAHPADLPTRAWPVVSPRERPAGGPVPESGGGPAPQPGEQPGRDGGQRPEVHPGVTPVRQQAYEESAGVYRVPGQSEAGWADRPPAAPAAAQQPGLAPHQPGPAAQQPDYYSPHSYTEPVWNPDAVVPTAEEFARRRAARPANPVATTGVRAALNRSSLGLVKLAPSRYEQELRRDIDTIRRNFGGLRQVTVVNPKGGAGKTVAILLLAMTFGQKRGGYVLAWDNNETQGTLGMRAQQDFHSRTVRDMLRDLGQFQGAHGRVGDLSQYVRAQGEGMFDVLASDESATGGEMLTAAAFAEIRDVVSRFYKLIFVDTGNNVRAQNWQAAIDATDQLVVTMSARNDSAETAARMLDHLEQSGRHRLVRQAVTVVSMPPSRREIDLPPIQRHFAARTRAVLLAPYERLLDSGEPIHYGQLSGATREAWLKIAAAVGEGL